MSLHIQINVTADEDGKFNTTEQNVLSALSQARIEPGQTFTPPAAEVTVTEETVVETVTEPTPAPKPAPKAPAKRAAKPAAAPKPSNRAAVLEDDPTDTPEAAAEEADPADIADAEAAAAGDPADDQDPTDEPTVTYDDVLARATELAAKSKQPEIKKVLSSIGGFGKVRELADADESVLKAFMNGLKDL